MIQSFHRFIVDHFTVENNAYPYNPVVVHKPGHPSDPNYPAPSPVTQLMGMDAKNLITCMNCQTVREKDTMTHVVDLIYPLKVLLGVLFLMMYSPAPPGTFQ